ncbi:MAG TPA: DoxX family protein, partial [Kofleriaceae bacterium]|nr:DoxX family protein [Kofleriaceae bacterium]
MDRARLETLAYTALRVVTGFMFFFHGSQKLLGFPGGKVAPESFSQMWIGGIIELVCGALIALGLLTRAAAFLASGMMAVAYMQFHWKGHFGADFLPIVNKGELAVVYCFVFFFFMCAGAGGLSVDSQLGK